MDKCAVNECNAMWRNESRNIITPILFNANVYSYCDKQCWGYIFILYIRRTSHTSTTDISARYLLFSFRLARISRFPPAPFVALHSHFSFRRAKWDRKYKPTELNFSQIASLLKYKRKTPTTKVSTHTREHISYFIDVVLCCSSHYSTVYTLGVEKMSTPILVQHNKCPVWLVCTQLAIDVAQRKLYRYLSVPPKFTN